MEKWTLKGQRAFLMKQRAAVFGAIALASAFLICHFSATLSYEERLIRTSLKDRFGPDARVLLAESPELQALFLDYSETPELVLKARIAIAKYGDEARSILTTYGVEAEFRDILSNYGENVIPVIEYFIDNDPVLTRMLHAAQQAGQIVMEKTKELFKKNGSQAAEQGDSLAKPADRRFGPTERGWYAVQRIHRDGHNFLGQFVIGSDKKAKWLQTERLFEGMTSFFASGVKNIETKYALDQEIKAADLFWAGVDAAVAVSFVKAVRAVKVARVQKAAVAGETLGTSGKEASFLNRTKLFASRLVPKGAMGRRILKLGTTAGVIYAIAAHPSVLNGVFAEIASLLGLNPFIIQVACWALLIFALSLPLIPLLPVLLALLIRALLTLVWAFRRFESVLAIKRSKRFVETIQPQVRKTY